MTSIPEAVSSHLNQTLIDGRDPACLAVSRDGILLASSGSLELYGLSGLTAGKPAADQLPMLVGLLQPPVPSTLFPQVQTPSGRHADVHLIPASDETWVVFLDVEGEHVLRQNYQQQANELSLLKERQGRSPLEEGGVLADLFAKLDMIVLELPRDGSIRVLGGTCAWLQQLYPDFASGLSAKALGERFPFLENFLIDASLFWENPSEGRLKSGAWVETTPDGEEMYLEASAARAGSKRILLIELLGNQYDQDRSLLQKAREISLEEQRRIKETQKKEILLHCIVHDLAGPLTGIKGCLSLLKFENLSSKGKELLEAGLRQSAKQEKWIRTILEVFSAEVASLETFSREATEAPDVVVCAQEVVQALLPAASAEKIGLRLSESVDLSRSWKVAGEKSRLERVLFNLVENALRHTSPASSVTLRVERRNGFITVMVDDEGPGIPPEVAGHLFQKFSQGEGQSGKVGLGLYFCRITVERWGGEIGCHSLPERGARFWFRLPSVG